MFVFPCPIIAKSVLITCPEGKYPYMPSKYQYLPSNIRISPRIQLPVSAQWSQRVYVKVQGKGCIKIFNKSYFNEINTFQNIGIKFK